MAKEDYDDDPEDDEDFDDEELDEEDEPSRPEKKPGFKPTPKKDLTPPKTLKSVKTRIGELKPNFQQVGFIVYKGLDDEGNESWIPFSDYGQAELYSEVLKLANKNG